MTNSGKVLLVETKGDQLNAESVRGSSWDVHGRMKAGSQYRYYMVFQRRPPSGRLTSI